MSKMKYQILAYEFIKRMLFAWDPDYTKVTEQEREKIAHAESSSFIDEDERAILKEEFDRLSPIEKAFAREKINYLSRYIYTFVNDKLASTTPYHELMKVIADSKKAKYQLGY